MKPRPWAALAIGLAILGFTPSPTRTVDRQDAESVGRIKGRVLRAVGSRRHDLPGVHLLLTSDAEPHRVHATASGIRGGFSLGSIPVGTYDLRAYRHDLGERRIEDFDVKALGVFTPEVVFSGTEEKIDEPQARGAATHDTGDGSTASLVGTFSMDSNEKVASGGIEFYRDGSEEKLLTLPVRDGSFSVTEIPAGVYDIRTAATGLFPLHLRGVRIPGGTGQTFSVHLVAPIYPADLPRERTEEWLPAERPIDRPDER